MNTTLDAATMTARDIVSAWLEDFGAALARGDAAAATSLFQPEG